MHGALIQFVNVSQPSVVRRDRARRRRRFAAAGLTAAAVTGVAAAAGPAAAAVPAQASTRVLVRETFTEATAPDFTGVGSACLTGAKAGTPGPGDHPLAGCPATEIGPVPPNGAAPYGYLRLTDSSNDQAGAVLYNHPLPASHGLDITFDTWQYGSTTPATPADGISFFLVNGDRTLTQPGAFGGSLGYAQKRPDDNPGLSIIHGVNEGYLGVGLDVLGNYFGDWEQRGNGCARRSPSGTQFRIPAPGTNMVTVRGPGDGIEGYCFLTATTSNFSTSGPWPSTLPGKLQGPLTALPPGVTAQQAQTLLEPSRRRIHITLTPGSSPAASRGGRHGVSARLTTGPELTVTVDFNDGTGAHTVLSVPAPEPVPATYKFGFAASTGLFTDTHLIRNVTIDTEEALPELDLVKQVEEPRPAHLTAGDRVNYEFVVTNSGPGEITGLTVTDPTVGPVTCPAAPLPEGRTVTCTATYVITAADVARGHVPDTAQAEGDANGTTITSPESSDDLPIIEPPNLIVEKLVHTPGPFHLGQTVQYSYLVTNTGGVRLDNIQISDDHVRGITCDATTLAPAGSPGDRTTCRGTYRITAADAANGLVTNHATATGTAGDQKITSPRAQATLRIGPAWITLRKRLVTPGPYVQGQLVQYSYLVTNTGHRTLHDIAVVDDRVARVTCRTTRLAPGQHTLCHGVYRITAQDLRSGHVTNLAQAGGIDARGDTFASHLVKVTIRVMRFVPVTG